MKCKPYNAIISQAYCEHNQRLATQGLRQLQAGRLVVQIPELLMDRAVTCFGQCKRGNRGKQVRRFITAQVEQYLRTIDNTMAALDEEQSYRAKKRASDLRYWHRRKRRQHG